MRKIILDSRSPVTSHVYYLIVDNYIEKRNQRYFFGISDNGNVYYDYNYNYVK